MTPDQVAYAQERAIRDAGAAEHAAAMWLAVLAFLCLAICAVAAWSAWQAHRDRQWHARQRRIDLNSTPAIYDYESGRRRTGASA